MRIPRIFTERLLSCGAEVALEAGAARHVTRVLRLKPGSSLTLFDGRGGEYRAVLLQAGERATRARVEAFVDVERESPLDITLLQGISRGDRMAYTLQKAAELGVKRIVPVNTARSVVDLQGQRSEKRRRRWTQVVRAAAEQSGRNRLPVIEEIQNLRPSLNGARDSKALLLAPDGKTPLGSLSVPQKKLHLLVGPEGGLNAQETALAEAAGFTALRLGPRILRTETAGPATLAIMQNLWGDIR